MISILIVEDDAIIGHAAELWLNKENRVSWARSLSEAHHELRDQSFDIILLDLGLPDGSGLELLNTLKRRKIEAGVLIMTAYGEVEDRVQGLDLGADDYMIKPLDFKELDARIRSIIRRKEGLSSTIIDHGNLCFDINGMTLTQNCHTVHLSKMEASILSILLQGKGRYYSKPMLEERLYHHGTQGDGNAIEVHISALRKKLGKDLIKTTRGLGYIIKKIPTT